MSISTQLGVSLPATTPRQDHAGVRSPVLERSELEFGQKLDHELLEQAKSPEANTQQETSDPQVLSERAAQGRQGAREMRWGDNALADPVSSAKRAPKVDRSQVDPQLLKAAEGLESMFLGYMMKVMRQTVPENELDLESPATKIYRSMLDEQYAQKAAHRGGVGLSEQIIDYLQGQRYNRSTGTPPGVQSNTQSGSIKEKP